MSDTQSIIVAVVVIVLIVTLLFRKGSVSFIWEFLGSKFKMVGQNTPATDKPDAATKAEGKKVVACGERSVAAGRDISRSPIITGDNSGNSPLHTDKNNS